MNVGWYCVVCCGETCGYNVRGCGVTIDGVAKKGYQRAARGKWVIGGIKG